MHVRVFQISDGWFALRTSNLDVSEFCTNPLRRTGYVSRRYISLFLFLFFYPSPCRVGGFWEKEGGTSGPYLVTRMDLVQNSETVEILVRSRITSRR